MATCTQAQLAPPSPSPSAMVTGPGSWRFSPLHPIPTPRRHPQKLGFAFAPNLSNFRVRLLTGTETGPWLPVPAPDTEPEEKEKPPDSLAPVAKPGKRRYAKVPMTEEEEEKLLDVRARHRSARKEMSARVERREELLKRRDEILFRRRCLAARLTNGIVVLRADADHVRHQRLVGWRFGKPMPEEIVSARNRITSALVLFADTCKALNAGLDAFMLDFQRKKGECPDQDLQQKKGECPDQGQAS